MQTTVLFALFFSALVAVSLSQTCTDSFTISIDDNVVFDLTSNGTIFGCPDSGGTLQDICTSRLDFDTQLRDYLLAKEFGCEIQCVKPNNEQNIRTEGTPVIDDVCYTDGTTSCNVTGSNIDEGACDSTGACISVVVANGCADGTREAFNSTTTYPDIAACEGSWSVAGVTSPPSIGTCAHKGGNSGSFPDGTGCSIADLCDVDWHVCENETEVLDAVGRSCEDSDFSSGEFFATQVSGNGNMHCTGTASGSNVNDIFGCGDATSPDGGAVPDATSCGALNDFGNDGCKSLDTTVWSCGSNPGTMEATLVTKGPKVGPGGALCCRN